MNRVLKYAIRFGTNRAYRNRVLQLIDRQTNNVEQATRAATDVQFLSGRRLFVAAGCEQTFMVEYLEQLGMETFHTFAMGRGSDPLTELNTPGSSALTERWDYYLFSVAQLLRGLVRRLQITGMDYSRSEVERDLEAVLDTYRQAIRQVREHTQAPILLYGYLLYYLPTYGFFEYRSQPEGISLVEFLHLFRLKLYGLAREYPGVYVFAADVATSDYGTKRVVDAFQSNGIFDHPTRDGAKILGDHFVRLLAILDPKRRRVKCAAFDLDGTLWSGILREDGPAGVAVQEYYLNAMEKLAARGILLAVCSKNDPVEAGHLAGLLGTEVYEKIAHIHLGWGPKSQALRDIAESLNIGLDSLAFFDDSPFERAEVAANAPEVLLFTPEDIFDCLNRIEFQPFGEITPESVSRTVKYQQNAQRQAAERTSGLSLPDFLASCELQLSVQSPLPGETSRIGELLQRTNQLNATLTRTSLEQLKEQLDTPERHFLRVARLRDRFGDYGLVGFISARKGPIEWEITDLAFSCRSMGRGVEAAVLALLAQTAIQSGASRLCIDFTAGPRNQQMLDILTQFGLRSEGGSPLKEGERTLLVKDLGADAQPAFPAWLQTVAG